MSIKITLLEVLWKDSKSDHNNDDNDKNNNNNNDKKAMIIIIIVVIIVIVNNDTGMKTQGFQKPEASGDLPKHYYYKQQGVSGTM